METTKLTESRIKKYLSEGKRFDNRAPDEFRNIEIETGISKNAEGSARVKLGKTEVIVGVKLDVAEPYPDSPDKGNLMVTMELLPLSSERFEPGPPRINSIEPARIIDRAIRESKFVDFEKLCIKKGEKVWTVFLDLYSINDDGNILDAAGIGALIALKDAKLPKYDEKEDKVLKGEPSNKKLPLADFVPLSITTHKIGKSLIVDPTREEEDVSETRMTLGGYDETICSIQKGEGKELDIEEVHKIFDIAEKTRKNLYKKIEKYLK